MEKVSLHEKVLLTLMVVDDDPFGCPYHICLSATPSLHHCFRSVSEALFHARFLVDCPDAFDLAEDYELSPTSD